MRYKHQSEKGKITTTKHTKKTRQRFLPLHRFLKKVGYYSEYFSKCPSGLNSCPNTRTVGIFYIYFLYIFSEPTVIAQTGSVSCVASD